MVDDIRDYNLQTLINASPVIITVIDPRTYTALYQNETGERALGPIKGKTCYKSIPGLDSVCAFCKMPQAIETGELQTSEVEHPKLGWLRVQFAAMNKSNGSIDIVETITDINEEKGHEEQFNSSMMLLADQEARIRALEDRLKNLEDSPE